MTSPLPGLIKSLTEQLQRQSGKPVKLQQKPGLHARAVARTAHGSADAHIIFFGTGSADMVSCAIAQELVRLIRLFEVPVEQRLVPMATSSMRLQALQELGEELEGLSKTHADEKLADMVRFWYNSVIRQLTHYPSNVRIAERLLDACAEIRDPLELVLKEEAAQAVKALGKPVKALTPTRIFSSANTMHVAYFSLLQSQCGLAMPGEIAASPFADEGRKLAAASAWSGRPDYGDDIRLVDLWADFLGLANWFGWTRFDALESQT